MTGLEYMRTVCPTTSVGRDPLKEDVQDAFEDGIAEGYEQAEKEMIDRAAAWIRAHWREYIMGPDKDGSIGFGHWENDFREAMKDK